MSVEVQVSTEPVDTPPEEQEAILADIIAIMRRERHRWLKKRENLLTPGPSPDTMEPATIDREGER